MTRRYILAPEAALDLVEVWRRLLKEASVEIADRVEAAIREKIVNSYLIVYRPETRPLQIVALLHGNRDVERILTERPI